jgi:hypothetical protein
MDHRNVGTEVVYPNKALEMLAEGKPSSEALEEALEALKFNDNEQNREIAQQVRERFIQDIQAMLDANPWRRDALDRASALVTEAAIRDSDRSIQALLSRIDAEVATFKLVLVKVDPADGKAYFRLHNPHFVKNGAPVEEQTVGVGDFVEGRFLVTAIQPTYVRLEDSKVKPEQGSRVLVARLLKPVEGE